MLQLPKFTVQDFKIQPILLFHLILRERHREKSTVMPAHLTFLGVVLVVWASVMHSASGSAQVPLMLHLKQVSQPLVSLSQIQVDEVQELLRRQTKMAST